MDATREAEQFAHLNLRSLFGDALSRERLHELAVSSVAYKAHQDAEFSSYLERLVSAELSGSSHMRTPILSGWEKQDLGELMTRHGGLLIGVFHFGPHRHLITDLALRGLPVSAPIAGNAYSQFYDFLATEGNPLVSDLDIHPVENEQVGRAFLKSLRRGRMGCVYVDGNMGPNGARTSSEITSVRFFDFQLRVKSGIARLAAMLRLPILPVMVAPSGELSFKELIFVDRNRQLNEEISRAMQVLYSHLESSVKDKPDAWEHAVCLHRWIHPEANAADDPTWANAVLERRTDARTSDERRTVNCSLASHRTGLIEQGDQLVLVDSRRGTCVQVPRMLESPLRRLLREDSVTIELDCGGGNEQRAAGLMDALAPLARKGYLQVAG